MTPSQAVQRLQQVLRRQHKSLSTESTYSHWLRRYVAFITRLPGNPSSEAKLEQFLTDLACNREVSASTQNQALNAILFFYASVLGKPIQGVSALRAKRPQRTRQAPTIQQTRVLLQAVGNEAGYPTNLVARMLYGCGLRVCEPLNLRIKDLQLKQGRLFIRGAKGGQDRVVPLRSPVLRDLVRQIDAARAIWECDRHNGTPVALPERLGHNYPGYQFAWQWAWLFPSHHTCLHPRTGVRVRYRMHEANVQRALKRACQQLGLAVLPHELRHGYATHCLEYGANPRAIQAAMGHKSLETTMGYLHAESLSVRSPLETLMVGHDLDLLKLSVDEKEAPHLQPDASSAISWRSEMVPTPSNAK
jgi:integrase